MGLDCLVHTLVASFIASTCSIVTAPRIVGSMTTIVTPPPPVRIKRVYISLTCQHKTISLSK
jgi:hypothetical protein